MLTVTEALQKNDAEMLKLLSAYQGSDEKLDEMTNGTDSAFNSKETSPEFQKSEDMGRPDSEMTEGEPSPSDYDAKMDIDAVLNNTKLSCAMNKTREFDDDADDSTMPMVNGSDPSLDLNLAQERMPNLQAQSNVNTSCNTTPRSRAVSYSTVTPTKELSFKKRAAAKYLASLQKNISFEEEKWYRCMVAPKDLFTELITALGVTAASSTDENYLMYECQEKNTHDCPYRVRIKSDSTLLMCEHNGCHWHNSDMDLPESSKASYGRINRGWFTCFDGPIALKTPLTASLCVATRNNFQDGYELYDCLYQKKFKCDYKVRVKQIDAYFICEELGSHRHGVEKELGSTTGLPSAFKDIVDVAFHKNWAYSVRQQKLAEAAAKFGLVWDRKLTRQIDNRLSYLRRTTNIRRAVELGKQKNGQEEE